MKLSLDSLRVLDAIERNDSFAGAAEELHRVPSAVTYAIKQLESDLGVKLFDRSGYRAQLTKAGQDLLDGGRSLLEQAQILEKKIKVSAGLAPQNVRIAYDGALGFDGVKSVLNTLFETFPDISVDLSAEILNGSRDALLSGSADLVIGCFAELPTETIYHYESLGLIPFVFAVAPHHPLADANEPLTHQVIAAHRIIIIPDTSKILPKAASGYAPDRAYLTVPSMESKIRAQAAGLGVGFIPLALAKPYLASGQLIEKEVDRPKAGGRCFLIWSGNKMSPALEFLINHIRQNKKKFLEGMQ
ncbi:MAG: LysR family transcriptional regulator [Alphaproteobacteria bacterium]|nr:LysR family transcriptional regulator [Alphaproteobacteria bacterium]